MPAPNPLTSTDQIRSWVNAINTWFNYIVGLVSNLTSGHIHNGTDSRKVNHTDLNSIGTNTHAQIDTAVTNSTNHIADSAIHVTSQNKTDWNGTKTEVENARNSTAKSTIYETLDARLEAIESESTPSSHNGLTRNNPATGPENANQDHLADALWDSTESQTVQDTLDKKLTESDLSTAINALSDNAIDGAKIETATGTSKGTMLLGAEGGAATFGHNHTFSDDSIKSGEYYGPLGISGVQAYVYDRINAINNGSFLKNEMLNGVFTFAGYDGVNDAHVVGQAVATYAKTTGIPGWHVDDGSSTNFIARVKTTDIGTPSWGDSEATTLRHRGRHGNAILELHSTGWDSVQTNIIYSDVMCIDSKKEYTLFFSYRNTTAQANYALCELEVWDGSAWIIQTIGEGDHWCSNADTNWHSHKFYCTPGYKFARLKFQIGKRESGNPEPCDIQLARIGFFEGNWESDTHIPPDAWFSPHIDYHSCIKSSLVDDTLPTPSETWIEWNAYKKTYYANLEVTSSWTGTGTLPLPKFNYIYNVKITPNYISALAVPTTPPTNVPIWYDYWSQDSAFNYNGSSNSITVAFPAPAIGSGYVTIEVDYWPADIADAELP